MNDETTETKAAERGVPVFLPDGRPRDGATAEQATKIANLAMRAVYDWLSKIKAFPQVATLEADYQNYERVFSNVGVHVADLDDTQGNVLWYQAFFERERPVTFKATKTIAAELAGLPGKEIEVEFASGRPAAAIKYRLLLRSPSTRSDWEHTAVVRMDGERAIGMDGQLVAERLPDGTWHNLGRFLVGKLTAVP